MTTSSHLRLTEVCQTERWILHGLRGMVESKRAKVLKQSKRVAARARGSGGRETTHQENTVASGMPMLIDTL